VTTQSWQCRPRTSQVSQSIRVVMSRTVTGATDNEPPACRGPACRRFYAEMTPSRADAGTARAPLRTTSLVTA
jgi:hypothetical protein